MYSGSLLAPDVVIHVCGSSCMLDSTMRVNDFCNVDCVPLVLGSDFNNRISEF